MEKSNLVYNFKSKIDNNHLALIVGGYVNGYSIIKGLSEKGVKNIGLFDYGNSIASKSNKILLHKKIEKSTYSLKNELFKLREKYGYIIIYPTDDLQLEQLSSMYDEIKDFCFTPINNSNILFYLNKFNQYKVCENIRIPYPKTIVLDSCQKLNSIYQLVFPIIIKPIKREDINQSVFRNLYCKSKEVYDKKKDTIKSYLDNSIQFIASEVIPGPDSNIFSYVAYRSKSKIILDEWVGNKLSQFPDSFGIFSSATNEAPDIIKTQGRAIVEAMDAVGICQPEFKYDYRDNSYKLMEVNFRSMMWHRVGSLSGVNLQYTQYLEALSLKHVKQNQNRSKKICYVYMSHELQNLLFRKKYIKTFFSIFFSKRKIYFAIFSWTDVCPFVFSLIVSFKKGLKRCLKVLKII